MRLSLAFLGNKSSECYSKIKEILARNDMIHVVKYYLGYWVRTGNKEG